MTGERVTEWMTVADDEVVRYHGADHTVFDGLRPDTRYTFDEETVTTLPRRGELLARIATVNDVHFGETVCGHVDGWADLVTFKVEPGETPYPETMNAGAVADITAADPDLVVVKGDVTSHGTQEEFDRFAQVYEGAFGEHLLAVRGNHESFHRLAAADTPFQERELDGVTVALLDTSREGKANGNLTASQLEQLDELGSRADRPVLVMGHHPVWDPAKEPRKDTTFGLLPDATEALAAVMGRRPWLVGYFAGHTHRNRVVHLPGAGEVPFVDNSCVKDFPGSWFEYRVFEGNVLQVHRRISSPAALDWTERTRAMFGGAYPQYVFEDGAAAASFEVWRG